jgi:hypothetical protein
LMSHGARVILSSHLVNTRWLPDFSLKDFIFCSVV